MTRELHNFTEYLATILQYNTLKTFKDLLTLCLLILIFYFRFMVHCFYVTQKINCTFRERIYLHDAVDAYDT